MVAHDATEPTLLPIRVMLIDGDADDRESLSRAITSCTAAELHVFEGVEGALEHLGATTALPHIIFADLGVRGIPALEMMHWLRCQARFLPVWLVGTTASLQMAVRPPNYYGADALLVKPVFPGDLAAVLALSANARSRGDAVPPG